MSDKNVCDNCDETIGRLEKLLPWDGHQLCSACYEKLAVKAKAERRAKWTSRLRLLRAFAIMLVYGGVVLYALAVGGGLLNLSTNDRIAFAAFGFLTWGMAIVLGLGLRVANFFRGQPQV